MSYLRVFWRIIRHPLRMWTDFNVWRGRQFGHEVARVLTLHESLTLWQHSRDVNPSPFDSGFIMGCVEYECMTFDTSCTIELPSGESLTCNSYGEWK